MTILLLPTFVLAQFDHEAIFPNESGEILLNKLVENFKPEVVLDFTSAKDTLYAKIYVENDSVTCVYTGHKLYLDPAEDPSQYMYKNGSSEGINAEHNYPKSKGAANGNALSDLYNLFPSRVQVNADRGNHPFSDIVDQQTTFWYYLTDKTQGIPSENIDYYSEGTSAFFEPREDHKGNVARSVFYFVSMYQDEVEQADPSFFESMRSQLCDWHYYDPVDSLEWERNSKIASYQSGKRNPFILDCSLAGRSYCDYIDDACKALNVDELSKPQSIHWRIYPNPAKDHFTIKSSGTILKNIHLLLVDAMGSVLLNRTLYENAGRQGTFTVQLDQSLEPGIYFIHLSDRDPKSSPILPIKLVIE
jgi:endonuclease I